ncbi:Lipoprotein signal peptidase [Arcticibacter svalbardensis MN12-7]|uniref:Lipoprotein signal peptidase n=1 Tax=Arcticibacter svalbardensis MN12-7 TaxID=1150600 RepID=R9GWY5_9SPHI|nr:signal peptidase II [Arcticibacter svalbardensis]EOR96143.1 Lipoprotein signal peptidase [Arcticibacter svalbardensis MN12-7]
MRLKKGIRNLMIVLIIACNIGCDQISKTIVREEVDYNENITLITRFLTLTKIENSGAFLSVGDSLPFVVRFIVLSLIPLIALGIGLYIVLTRTSMKRPIVIGICFVIGGGIGNLYDRMLYGSVTDFLHMDFVLFKTGIFNMADVSIMIGIGTLIVFSYIAKNKRIQYS